MPVHILWCWIKMPYGEWRSSSYGVPDNLVSRSPARTTPPKQTRNPANYRWLRSLTLELLARQRAVVPKAASTLTTRVTGRRKQEKSGPPKGPAL